MLKTNYLVVIFKMTIDVFVFNGLFMKNCRYVFFFYN